jgi:hypothetical protein
MATSLAFWAALTRVIAESGIVTAPGLAVNACADPTSVVGLIAIVGAGGMTVNAWGADTRVMALIGIIVPLIGATTVRA